MALGPHCKTLGIDEEVLNGQKSLTCEIKSLTNGIMFELKKYKTSKRLTMKDVVDWLIKIFEAKCENTETVQEKLNEKIESFLNMRNTLMKAPNKYRGEMERLMNWPFDLPPEMGIDPPAVFEPVVSANLGPKLLKVLKEKGGDDDDSIDMSGPSDDDDEQIKKKKAREEIIQLKKDLGAVKKVITSLNDRMVDLNKQCQVLNDFSKTSVSERRRIENDVTKLKNEWCSVMSTWHDCMERLNHVNSNKGNYLDVGYMVRRNKTKQGIFDELNFEFEKTLEEFKHKVVTLIEKERRKKKVVSREYRQKSKTDRKRVRQESDENEESKKQCLSEEVTKSVPPLSPTITNMGVDEFMKSEKIDEFKGGKFINALKAIYLELTSMPLTCNNVHEILFTVLDELEPLNTDKIPTQSFAGAIFMEARMAVALQAFLDVLNMRKASICNDSTVKFAWENTDYDVTLGDETHIKLGVRDISKGSPDSSLNSLKDIFQDIINFKTSGTDGSAQGKLMKVIEAFAYPRNFLDKKLVEILFSYKQQVLPTLSETFSELHDNLKTKVTLMNNFYTGLYFLYGLAKIADVTVLAWESVCIGGTNLDFSKNGIAQLFSKTVQDIFTFCEKLDAENQDDLSLEFKDFIKKEKKLESVPLAPHKGNIFNVIFHNTAGIWFYHEIGLLNEFSEKVKEKEDITNSLSELLNEKHSYALARALGLLGKLVAVPFWTVLEDDKVEVGLRYTTLLQNFEKWAKDSSKFMKGQERLFEDVPVSHDAVYVSLIKDNESTDAFTKELLELLFTAFMRYAKYFLYGASNFEKMNGESGMDVDEDNKVIKLLHEDFKLFDQITMSMHFATQFASEALTFCNNTRNGEWKDNLFGKDNAKISGNYELVKDLVGKDCSKQLKDLYKRKIKLTEMEQAKPYNQQERSNQLEKKYKLIDDLIKWGGLWKSEKEIDAQIKNMPESDQLNAFKAQIRFRRHVLGEEHSQGLLDLASEGECFNAHKLYENLKTILKKECEVTETNVFELASAAKNKNKRDEIYNSLTHTEELKPVADYSPSAVPKENFHWLLGKLVSHTIASEQTRENLTGVCIARKKLNGAYSYFIRYKGKGVFNIPESRIAEDYKNKLLKIVDPSPNDLIGSELSRAFIKDDGDLEWHDCKVVGVDKNGCDFVIEFELCLVDESVAEEYNIPEIETLTYTSRLLDDYRNHHLRLL
ncbi:uncharacterized protein LOC129219225 [Uloborus diversus]|uniref:uncharacterized protein LOC129219225 n=1 Tax=Uloborus diversus TaxID=327109 RepID=UPI0024090292|nr:uncharacterized protein LOC129219225 [Uloborus diversus]